MNGESQTATDPGKGVCGGVKIFGSALLRPARSVCVSPSAFLFLNIFVYNVVSSQRGSDSNHSYSARFVDGKLVYEGTVYELGQHILIETRNSPAVQYVFVVHFLLNNTLQYNCL